MLDLSQIKVDTDKLDKGAWWVVRMEAGQLLGEQVDKPAPDKPALLIVPRSYGYERQLERESEPHLSKMRRDDISDADRETLMTKVAGIAIAKKILRGWQNISFGGESSEWSEEAAIEALTSRAWKGLADFCLSASGDRQAILAAQEAEATGN